MPNQTPPRREGRLPALSHLADVWSPRRRRSDARGRRGPWSPSTDAISVTGMRRRIPSPAGLPGAWAVYRVSGLARVSLCCWVMTAVWSNALGVLGSPWRVSRAPERRKILEEVLQRRPGGEHGRRRGPPRRRGLDRGAACGREDHGSPRAGGLPPPAGQEARMAGENLEALRRRGIDLRLERTAHPPRERSVAAAVNVRWIGFERPRRGTWPG
jgi:hypothetical protein